MEPFSRDGCYAEERACSRLPAQSNWMKSPEQYRDFEDKVFSLNYLRSLSFFVTA